MSLRLRNSTIDLAHKMKYVAKYFSVLAHCPNCRFIQMGDMDVYHIEICEKHRKPSQKEEE